MRVASRCPCPGDLDSGSGSKAPTPEPALFGSNSVPHLPKSPGSKRMSGHGENDILFCHLQKASTNWLPICPTLAYSFTPQTSPQQKRSHFNKTTKTSPNHTKRGEPRAAQRDRRTPSAEARRAKLSTSSRRPARRAFGFSGAAKPVAKGPELRDTQVPQLLKTQVSHGETGSESGNPWFCGQVCGPPPRSNCLPRPAWFTFKGNHGVPQGLKMPFPKPPGRAGALVWGNNSFPTSKCPTYCETMDCTREQSGIHKLKGCFLVKGLLFWMIPKGNSDKHGTAQRNPRLCLRGTCQHAIRAWPSSRIQANANATMCLRRLPLPYRHFLQLDNTLGPISKDRQIVGVLLVFP